MVKPKAYDSQIAMLIQYKLVYFGTVFLLYVLWQGFKTAHVLWPMGHQLPTCTNIPEHLVHYAYIVRSDAPRLFCDLRSDAYGSCLRFVIQTEI